MRETRTLPVLLAAGLLAALGYLAVERYVLAGELGFPLDDSWIHLQFARSVAQGGGLAYNPGEPPVGGSTAPLWTALLALGFALPGSPLAWAKVLGVGLYLAGVHATFRLARELGARVGFAALAAGLMLSTSWMVWSALSGMEIPLFIALSTWGLALHVRARRRSALDARAWAALAASALARPEGLLLLALAVLDACLRFERRGEGLVWRPPVRGLGVGIAVAAILVVPVALVYVGIGGSPLPTTFAAKSATLRRWLPDLRYLHAALGILLASQPWMLLFAGAGVARLLARLGRQEDRGLLPALWLLGLPLAYSLLSPGGAAVLVGNFGRYLFPLFPVLAVVGSLGLEAAVAPWGGAFRVGRWRLAWRVPLLALLLWPTLSDLVRGAERFGSNLANVRDGDVAAARWLAPRLPPAAVLAVNDIGALKFLLPNRVLDLAGIVHPEVRRLMAEAGGRGRPWQEGIGRFLAEHRPDYLVVFPSWFPGLLTPDNGFRPLHTWRIPDNITMGGDEIVLYSTPWTRHPLRSP